MLKFKPDPHLARAIWEVVQHVVEGPHRGKRLVGAGLVPLRREPPQAHYIPEREATACQISSVTGLWV